MMRFTYKAMDAQSRFITGEMDAADAGEVAHELNKLGYVMLDAIAGTRADAIKSGFGIFTLRRPAGHRDITVFLRELALVLRAGVALDEALLLLVGEESAGLAAIIRDLRVAITSGASFGDALERHPRLFGPDLVTMVRIAEASGNLDGVLESVGEERARLERLLDKISSALRYPAFLLLVALSVLVFFLVVVVPQFASVLRDFGHPPDGLAGFVLAASDFMLANGSLMLGILLPLAVILFFAFRRPHFRGVVMRYLSRLPGLRGILELRRTVLFCSSLATLLGNGVTLSSALRVLVDLPGAAAGGLDRVVETVRRGGRLVDALGHVGYIPPLALNMLRVGEESGELATVARRTAEFYESKLSDRLDRLAGIVGPAAIIAIAGIVGTLIVSILSALLSVNQLIN
jgi:general secretion pathway protein F